MEPKIGRKVGNFSSSFITFFFFYQQFEGLTVTVLFIQIQFIVSKYFQIEQVLSFSFCKKGYVNSLPNNKILNVTKLKAFVDDKLTVARMMIFLFDKVENTVGKGENAGYQHFLLFLECFPKLCSYGSLRVGIVW